ARQRLGARQAFATQVDLGLIPDLEPAVAQRLIEFDGRTRAGDRIDQCLPLGVAEVVDGGPAPCLVGRFAGCHEQSHAAMVVVRAIAPRFLSNGVNSEGAGTRLPYAAPPKRAPI